MSPETLTALKASIKHWEENVAAETPDKASSQPEDCALCSAFAFGSRHECTGCPVRDRTKQSCCEGSPYVDADYFLKRWGRDAEYKTAFRAAAQAELDFLRSLLPEGER